MAMNIDYKGSRLDRIITLINVGRRGKNLLKSLFITLLLLTVAIDEATSQTPVLRNVSIEVQGDTEALIDIRTAPLFDTLGRPIAGRPNSPGQYIDFELRLIPDFTAGQVMPPASAQVTVSLEQVNFIPLISEVQGLTVDTLPPQGHQAVFLAGNNLALTSGSNSRIATVSFMNGEPATIRVRLAPGNIRAVRRVEATVVISSADFASPSGQVSVSLGVQVPTPDQFQQLIVTDTEITVNSVGGISTSNYYFYPENGPVVPLEIGFRYFDQFGNSSHFASISAEEYSYSMVFYRPRVPGQPRAPADLLQLFLISPVPGLPILGSASVGETLLVRIRDSRGSIIHRAAQCGSDTGATGGSSMCEVEVSASGQLILTDTTSSYFAEPAIRNFNFVHWNNQDANARRADFQLISGQASNLTLDFIPDLMERSQSVEVDLVQQSVVDGRKTLSPQGAALEVDSNYRFVYAELEQPNLVIPYPGLTVESVGKVTEHVFSPGLQTFDNQTQTLIAVDRSQQIEVIQAVGVLESVTLTADRRIYTPEEGSRRISIAVMVSLSYEGVSISRSAETQLIELRVVVEGSEATIGGNLQLLFDTSDTLLTEITLDLATPEGAIVTLSAAPVRAAEIIPDSVLVRLIEQLAVLEILAPSLLSQSEAGSQFSFPVTVNSFSSLNRNPFNLPGNRVLEVSSLVNAAVDSSTYSLVFSNGTAMLQLNADLLIQGIDGELSLRVSSGNISASADIQLAAVPVLSTVMVNAVQANYSLARRDETVDVVIEVALTYVGAVAELEMLTLTISPSTNTAIVSNDELLTFAHGEAVQTTITLALGAHNNEVSFSLGIGGAGDATVVGTTVILALNEVLAELAIDVESPQIQSETGAAFSFTVTVTANGSVGTPFNGNLVLDVSNVRNATSSTYVLSFSDGVATAEIGAGLLSQGHDGELQLAVNSADLSDTAQVILRAQPILSTVTVSVVPAVYTVTRRDETVAVAVTVELNYLGAIAESEVLELTVDASTDTAAVSGDQRLVFMNGTAVQTTVTLALGAANDEVTFDFGIDGAGDATVAGTAVALSLNEVLAELVIDVGHSQIQSEEGAAFGFTVTVTATGSVGTPFTGILMLDVSNVRNATSSTYALVFVDGEAVVDIEVALLSQGSDGEVLLSVSSEYVSDTVNLRLQAQPILDLVEVIARSSAYTVRRRDEVVEVPVTVMLEYAGTAAATETLTLVVTPSVETVVVRVDEVLTFENGIAVQTTVSLTLGESNDEVLFAMHVEGSGDATVIVTVVKLTLVEALADLVIDVASEQMQREADAAFTFTVTVTALGSVGSRFDPGMLVLEANNLRNATSSTYALVFKDGVATAQVEAELLTQGSNGGVFLTVSSAEILGTANTELLALPVLSRVNLNVPRTVYAVESRVEAVTVPVVVSLVYVDNIAATEMLTLTVTASTDTAEVNEDRLLTFTNSAEGQMVVTGLSLILGEPNDEATFSLGIEGAGNALVESTMISLVLSGILAELAVDVMSSQIQSEVGAAFAFTVTVTAAGSADGTIDPVGLVLHVDNVSNAHESTYSLVFADGVATADIEVELLRQGSDGEVLLSVSSEDILDTASIQLRALPVLSTVTVSVENTTYTVLRRNQIVKVPVMVALNYIDNIAAAEMLTLVTASSDTVIIGGDRQLVFNDGMNVQTLITLKLGGLSEAGTVMLGVAGAGYAEVEIARVTVLWNRVIAGIAGLVDDAGADNSISIADLLAALRLVNGRDEYSIKANLAGQNSDTATLLSLIKGPEGREVLDVNIDGQVDASDFRLILRYLSKLRGPALCNYACFAKISLLMEK